MCTHEYQRKPEQGIGSPVSHAASALEQNSSLRQSSRFSQSLSLISSPEELDFNLRSEEDIYPI